MNNKPKFSEQVRDMREVFNLSQKQLAKKCGVNQSEISNIEVERHEPRMNIFLKICKVLEIDPRMFL